MRRGLSTTSIKAILIVAGLLILVCSFFFVYRPNQDKVMQLQTEMRQYKNQVNYLSTLQMQVNELQETTPIQQKEIDAYMSKFSSQSTQQKEIYNVYKMMVSSGLEVTAIQPGSLRTFYNAGQFISLTENAAATTTESGEMSDVEKNPEQLVGVTEMIGKVATYSIEVAGTKKQLMKALDWVSENKELMSVNGVSVAYDSSIGKLSGTIVVNYFAMHGNGQKYSEPDISGITLGTDSIFGVMKE